MAGLHPEGLKAAHAALAGGIESAITAYLAVAHPEPKTSAEEQGRFIGADGVPVVSVVVARSVPFAKALLHEWSLVDGKDRDWMIKFKALVIPAATYDAILPAVRRRLRPGGLDE